MSAGYDDHNSKEYDEMLKGETRFNTFSALRSLVADKHHVYIGPIFWRSKGGKWAYEYQTRPMGILKIPIIKF